MKGNRPDNGRVPSPVFEDGRVCEAPGCETRLSVYNSSRRCWQHQEVNFPTYRGKRLAKSPGV